MPGPGRNDPCPCGSGRKTKRCCGEQRGPSAEQVALARLAALTSDAIDDLAWLSDDALDQLREDVFDLPGLDLSLHVQLPDLAGPDRKRLQRAITDPDSDGAWETVEALAAGVGTPQQRVRLAEALIRLREQRRVGRREFAYAMLDLGNGGRYLIMASVLHALATHLGGDPTPGGLLIAA
jgi:hypothetical protein